MAGYFFYKYVTPSLFKKLEIQNLVYSSSLSQGIWWCKVYICSSFGVMTLVSVFFRKLKKHCGIAFRKLKLVPNIKNLWFVRKKISVEFCFFAKKLKFEIMCQHHTHFFEALATLAGMKRSGSDARYNTVASNNSSLYSTVISFTFEYVERNHPARYWNCYFSWFFRELFISMSRYHKWVHWEIDQVTAYPFVVYYSTSGPEISMKLECVSFFIIDDCLEHTASTLHSFVSCIIRCLVCHVLLLLKKVLFQWWCQFTAQVL